MQRHAFASLLIYEGRLSVVDIAAQLGHNPTVCLDTYAHVMAEQRGGDPISAEAEISSARMASFAATRDGLEGRQPAQERDRASGHARILDGSRELLDPVSGRTGSPESVVNESRRSGAAA